MEKIHKPTKLIKYASLDDIEKGQKLRITSRLVAYSVVLALLTGVLAFLLVTRTSIETTILRTPGMLYQQLPGDKVSNLYNFELVNKTFKDIPLEFKMNTPGAEIRLIGNQTDLRIKQEEILKGALFIDLPKSLIKKNKTSIEIEVISNGKVIDRVKTSFLGPVNE